MTDTHWLAEFPRTPKSIVGGIMLAPTTQAQNLSFVSALFKRKVRTACLCRFVYMALNYTASEPEQVMATILWIAQLDPLTTTGVQLG